jgi:hypothetical protein
LLKWAAVALAEVTLLITVTFFAWWAKKEQLVFGQQRFDLMRWVESPLNKHRRACQRGEMALDIRDRLLQPGMSKTEVTALLGRPSWEEGGEIEYDLGVCLWVVHGLRLYFDPQERLTHSTIAQH